MTVDSVVFHLEIKDQSDFVIFVLCSPLDGENNL